MRGTNKIHATLRSDHRYVLESSNGHWTISHRGKVIHRSSTRMTPHQAATWAAQCLSGEGAAGRNVQWDAQATAEELAAHERHETARQNNRAPGWLVKRAKW